MLMHCSQSYIVLIRTIASLGIHHAQASTAGRAGMASQEHQGRARLHQVQDS